ncbi:hypothetical protein [Foetidibacter luteolus]|uniref:hypothetical protein n=1 Tax=Foetidibacter luteolus TaxID=2608880 RepID=UPI00129B528A|nr:hypothetical protein [Foetidibacter luteolus]
MTQDVHFQINNGNSNTVVIEDASASRTFWSNYFTQSYVSQKDHFQFQGSFDLMGRPITSKKPTPKLTTRKSFGRKQRRSKIS